MMYLQEVKPTNLIRKNNWKTLAKNKGDIAKCCAAFLFQVV